MNQIELLRHVADNIEAAMVPFKGLLYQGEAIKTNQALSLFVWDYPEHYTLAPRTHTVNGFVVPAPMDVKPSRGERYNIVDFTEADLLYSYSWAGDPADNRMFKRGLCFTTKEAAQQNALAMLGRDPAKGVDGV